MDEKMVEEIAKDVCWEDGGGVNCKMDCPNCKAGHFKKWKWIVRIVVKKCEGKKNASKN